MARHELALCTPATAALYWFRLGQRPVLELPYREPIDWGGLRLTTFPAGHCLGSAMLLAEQDDQSLLYTGDFKLDRALTAESAEFPRADVLVMESTYGEPRYRMPPRAEVEAELVDVVRRALVAAQTPVIQAYTLGKAQEVTRLLTDANIPVLWERTVAAVSQVYAACGVALGDAREWPGYAVPGHAVIVPPRMHRALGLGKLGQAVHVAVTGWALDRGTAARWGVDHAVPLSDHADFDQLLEAVARVDPKMVYCTHGPASFVDHVRRAGWPAERLERPNAAPQGWLF